VVEAIDIAGPLAGTSNEAPSRLTRAPGEPEAERAEPLHAAPMQ
jgi:hypothetical protein